MTWAQKVQAYREGRYRFHVPPVCHYLWGESEWVRYIDSCNGWA